MPNTVKRAARCLVALVIVLGQWAPAGAVLCVAPGDHRALETVGSDGCHSLPAAAAVEIAGAVDDGCPPGCKDTPLNNGPALRSAGDGDVVAAAAAAAYEIGSPILEIHPGFFLFVSDLPRFTPISTARLRSTILRC